MFCCLGGDVFYVCCLGGGAGEGVFHFLLFGLGACFLVCCSGRTGDHSLTGLPGRVLRGLSTKKTEQQKKHGFRKSPIPHQQGF